MTLLTTFTSTSVILNRFLIKQLQETDLTVYEYQCQFTQTPEEGKQQQALAQVCYKVGVTAVRLGRIIITKEEISTDKLKSNNWQLVKIGTKLLSYNNPTERQALETFERKILEKKLKRFTRTKIEKALEGGIIWWVTDDKEIEKHGNGWEIRKGRRIDVVIDSSGNLYLEIDIHHHFHTPWTLHQWLEKYPDIPIKYVRNTYKDNNNNYINWCYENLSDESPHHLLLQGLNTTLADYHRNQGASEAEINNSRVVYVKKANQWNAKPIAHLSQRLSPSLTIEMLANIAEKNSQNKEITAIFGYIKKSLNDRLDEAKETAQTIIERLYHISRKVSPLRVNGYILPPAKLLGANHRPLSKTSQVASQGCMRVGETKLGCFNLFSDTHKYPEEVRKCLLNIARNSGNIHMDIDSYRTKQDFPTSTLEQQIFWQNWSSEGVKTVLVVMGDSDTKDKQKIRLQALQAGIATQFMKAQPKADSLKALNVVLGLLCKAGWQTIGLEPFNHPETADLIMGFDTGTNRQLYYGTSAFAVLADGQSLGWELPNVQRGETFSGQAIWQTVSQLVLKFDRICNRYPKKILLMRDGLVQEGEFQQTIDCLKEQEIALDVVGVRKSGAGRMGQESQNGTYNDARMGTVIFEEKSFTFVSSQSMSKGRGSARPLRVVHAYGSTPLEVLALQTYHLTQLHPASAFRSSRLPWVLHLADKSSKEFQRIGQISVLQNISRDKLIAV